MVHQELDAKSQSGVNSLLRIFGFFLSIGTIYLIVVWTLELSQVEVRDLPVVRNLEPDFKKRPLEKNQEIIENGDLSINSLRGNENGIEETSGLGVNPFEEMLTSEEKPVPLSMKEALENSIAKALDSLTQEEIVFRGAIYQVYLGSFDDHQSALEKLKSIHKIEDLPISETFSIVSGVFDGTSTSYRLETKQKYTYENAKTICNKIISYKIECKVITG